MKILFLTDNFPPEVNAPATRTFEHCREWVKDDLCRATPEEALDRGISLLEVIAGRPTYVALLYQYPELLKRVGRILASSRWAAS